MDQKKKLNRYFQHKDCKKLGFKKSNILYDQDQENDETIKGKEPIHQYIPQESSERSHEGPEDHLSNEKDDIKP